MSDPNRLREELEKVEQAIAAQEALRGILPQGQLEAALALLREKQQAILIALQGSGAIAHGAGAQAAGERAAIARDVAGHQITGDNVVIGADSAQAEAERAEMRYLRRLRQRCNVLPLAAMGGDEGVGDEVSLEQVYVGLNTRTPVPLSEKGKEGREGEDTRPLTALEAATQSPHLALLGDPGSGKSTFVRQLAAWLVAARLGEREPLHGWEPDLVPALITLRELAPRLAGLDLQQVSGAEQETHLVGVVRQSLSDALAACKAEAWDAGLEDALTAGRVLLIFDGLDEVAGAGRARARRAVLALLQAYPAVRRVIVTCRVRSYTGAVALPGFGAHTLAPFDGDKIRDFVAGWYRAQFALGRLSEEQTEGQTADLQRAASSAELRDLASNPMLLTTMALIHQREVRLPSERVRLYALAVQVLLTRWQKRKGIAVSDGLAAVLVDDLKLRGILERLAYEAHRQQASGGEMADLPRSELLLLLEDPAHLGDLGLAGEFLDYVDQRAGLLVGQGGGEEGQRPQTYAFPHRTFQEYLTGCHLVGRRGTMREYWQRAGEGDYWTLAARLGAEDLLYNRRSGPELLDLAYDLSPEVEPDDERAWRATVWSGQMAALLGREAVQRDAERPDGGEAYLRRLLPRLVQVLRQTPLRAAERAEAGRALARLDDPRFCADAWHLPEGPVLSTVEGPVLSTVEGPVPSTAEGPLLGFVEVPAGEFLLGEGKEQHLLWLPRYYIGRYPVTSAQFRAFVTAGGYGAASYWREAEAAGVWQDGEVKGWGDDEPRRMAVDYGGPFDLANHPAVGVTWYEALAYCRWLTEVLRAWKETPELLASLLGDGWAVTLPSEAEWEKAASWDAATGRKRVYPWGHKPDSEKANYGDTGIGATTAVGCFPGGTSPYGVEDLSGNVWEWTRSHWESYPYDPADGREGLRAGGDVRRVLRGGAFFNYVWDVRCAFRPYRYPDYRDWGYGFRVVVVSPSALNSGASGPWHSGRASEALALDGQV